MRKNSITTTRELSSSTFAKTYLIFQKVRVITFILLPLLLLYPISIVKCDGVGNNASFPKDGIFPNGTNLIFNTLMNYNRTNLGVEKNNGRRENYLKKKNGYLEDDVVSSYEGHQVIKFYKEDIRTSIDKILSSFKKKYSNKLDIWSMTILPRAQIDFRKPASHEKKSSVKTILQSRTHPELSPFEPEMLNFQITIRLHPSQLMQVVSFFKQNGFFSQVWIQDCQSLIDRENLSPDHTESKFNSELNMMTLQKLSTLFPRIKRQLTQLLNNRVITNVDNDFKNNLLSKSSRTRSGKHNKNNLFNASEKMRNNTKITEIRVKKMKNTTKNAKNINNGISTRNKTNNTKEIRKLNIKDKNKPYTKMLKGSSTYKLTKIDYKTTKMPKRSSSYKSTKMQRRGSSYKSTNVPWGSSSHKSTKTPVAETNRNSLIKTETKYTKNTKQNGVIGKKNHVHDVENSDDLQMANNDYYDSIEEERFKSVEDFAEFLFKNMSIPNDLIVNNLLILHHKINLYKTNRPQLTFNDMLCKNISSLFSRAITLPDCEILFKQPKTRHVQRNIHNKHFRFLNSYLRYDEIVKYMRDLERTHKGLLETVDIGASYEGRRMILAKISSTNINAKKGKSNNVTNKKPAIWIDGGIHAREWITVAVAVNLINKLTNGYRKNPTITQLVNKYDWYILPCLNPDGYEYTHTHNRFWRKSRSQHHKEDGYFERKNCVGVDLNRNYNIGRGQCETNDINCESETYHGPFVFSENETINVMKMLRSLSPNLIFYLNLHSYMQVWFLPWGHTDLYKPKDYDLMYQVSKTAVQAMTKLHGMNYTYGTPGEILYNACGSVGDFVKKEIGVKYAFSIELRDQGQYGFLLPWQQIKHTFSETWVGIRAALKEIDRLTNCSVNARNCKN